MIGRHSPVVCQIHPSFPYRDPSLQPQPHRPSLHRPRCRLHRPHHAVNCVGALSIISHSSNWPLAPSRRTPRGSTNSPSSIAISRYSRSRRSGFMVTPPHRRAQVVGFFRESRHQCPARLLRTVSRPRDRTAAQRHQTSAPPASASARLQHRGDAPSLSAVAKRCENALSAGPASSLRAAPFAHPSA